MMRIVAPSSTRWSAGTEIFAVLEDDDHSKLVKFGFVREGADRKVPMEPMGRA